MDTIHPLKAFREKQRPPLSQEQLGSMLGVARTTVARWETGARKIDDELVPRVVRATGIPASKLRPDLADLLKRVAVA
jgi:transcriptional regulator with XRE-family HTH domain